MSKPAKFKDVLIPDRKELYQDRFWGKVAITANSDKCWLWQAGIGDNGYGKFVINRQKGEKSATFSTHRVSYFLYYNIQPIGNVVMHACDNKACVNPHHLKLGTFQENTQDMMGKGRHGLVLGERHGQSKLTANDVREIRQAYIPYENVAELASKYGIAPKYVRQIALKQRWKHIQ